MTKSTVSDELVARLKAVKIGGRVGVPKTIHPLSFHALFGRGDAHSCCDRFELTPPHGRGPTGSMWYLFGYRGDECLLVSALPFDPIARKGAPDGD